MAYDPRDEDYQRMALCYARSLSGSDPFGAARATMDFGRRLSQRRDSLPQSDRDRAFHLVAEAADLIDYQLPFVPDEEVSPMVDEARGLLEEALDLDAECYDAQRMLEAADHPSFESYSRFLAERADAVREGCERARERDGALVRDGVDALEADLAMRPYLRWMAAQASRSLICGRYRQAIELGEALLGMDEWDPSDVRFTLAFAYAKLEDEEGLADLAHRTRQITRRCGGEDPWYLLARIALAYKRRDRREAEGLLENVMHTFPNAAFTLARQDELPDGVFCRLAVPPGSEDELILAVSEGSVLLQEGRDLRDRGSLGAWVGERAAVAMRLERDGGEAS